MQTDNDDMLSGMPSDFEVLEVRRALHLGRVDHPDVDKAWEHFRQTLEPESEVAEEPSASRFNRPIILKIIAAAAAVAVLVLAITPLLKGRKTNSVEVFSAVDGAQQVTLTADNGTPQVVQGKTLAFNRPIQRTEHIRMMEVSNPRGKVSRVILPDGSTVWLNADSHLSFPERFVGNTREVGLSGEACFDVKHDSRHPFVVTTTNMVTTVHGTVFDVCAYSAKSARVTLLEGSVSVKNKDGAERFIKPGQMAQVSADGNMQLSDVDTYGVTQWTEGFFYFGNSRLADMMMELGRWYNVNIVFENEQAMDLRLHFVAEHKDNLATIISRINELGIVNVSLEDDVVTIY